MEQDSVLAYPRKTSSGQDGACLEDRPIYSSCPFGARESGCVERDGFVKLSTRTGRKDGKVAVSSG
jgi:hypothetical protein